MRFSPDLMRGLTPLLVLETLVEDTLPGLEVVQRIKERGDGLDVPEGTIYPLLYRLEKQGLIAGSWRKVPGQRKQRVYALTDDGRHELAAEKRRWNQLMARVQPFLGRAT
jgi:DNA-binding PadR family transcriptional regulator